MERPAPNDKGGSPSRLQALQVTGVLRKIRRPGYVPLIRLVPELRHTQQIPRSVK